MNTKETVERLIEFHTRGSSTRLDTVQSLADYYEGASEDERHEVDKLLEDLLNHGPLLSTVKNNIPANLPALAITAIARFGQTERLPMLTFDRLEWDNAESMDLWAQELPLTLQACVNQYAERFTDATLSDLKSLCDDERFTEGTLSPTIVQNVAIIKTTVEWIEAERFAKTLRSSGDQRSDGASAGPRAISSWERIKPLGSGGQSDVFLARNPTRVAERALSTGELVRHSGRVFNTREAQNIVEAAWNCARPELPTEMGALKIFKTRAAGLDAEQQAIDRLKSEIQVLSQNRPGLPKLLASNIDERWIVTQYYPNLTLEHHLDRFKGNVALALAAYRSLVQTVSSLHQDRIVHRDIKPANVFIADDSQLVLGDLGIVYLPDRGERLTMTGESVGPHDYVPPWADLGMRQNKVEPNFDVYMLGKLLWCMVSGKMKLPREWHKRDDYNLTVLFPYDPHMHMINVILDKCVVEDPKQCLPLASHLLMIVDTYLQIIDRGGQLLAEDIPRPCHVCGFGFYRPEVLRPNMPASSLRIWVTGSESANLNVRLFICDKCGHVEFFRPI